VDDAGAEITWNNLMGDAIVLRPPASQAFPAFRYDAYPHQRLVQPQQPDPSGAGVLSLDGTEYCRAPGVISFPAFASGYGPVQGFLTVLDLDLDVNLGWDDSFFSEEHWNEDEVRNSIGGIDFCKWRQIGLGPDLGLTLGNVHTPNINVQLSARDNPLWVVFYQIAGQYAWGGNVWQNELEGRDATLVVDF
jgi:hypothetical protein